MLQLVLQDEVSPDRSSVKRSQTTGKLLISMSKVCCGGLDLVPGPCHDPWGQCLGCARDDAWGSARGDAWGVPGTGLGLRGWHIFTLFVLF